MNREQLEQAVIQWGNDKELNDPWKQTLKTLSEAGELADAMCQASQEDLDNPYEFKRYQVIDAIGDIEVCLTILKNELKADQDHCLNEAWKVIKNRTGKTLNGTFIKE